MAATHSTMVGSPLEIASARVKHPGQGQLPRRAGNRLGNSPQGLGQMQIALEVITLKPGMAPTPVVRRNVLRCLEPPREEAAPKRAIGDKANAQFTARPQHLAFNLTTTNSEYCLEVCGEPREFEPVARYLIQELQVPDIRNLKTRPQGPASAPG
jgi:hypothetical protein